MMGLGPRATVVLSTEPVDLRRGHDGLITLVKSKWNADPYDGTLFVFLGRRLDRVKVLFFSSGGFVVYYKRMERGRFTLPRVAKGATRVELDAVSLAMLLDGIEMQSVRRVATWKPMRKTG